MGKGLGHCGLGHHWAGSPELYNKAGSTSHEEQALLALPWPLQSAISRFLTSFKYQKWCGSINQLNPFLQVVFDRVLVLTRTVRKQWQNEGATWQRHIENHTSTASRSTIQHTRLLQVARLPFKQGHAEDKVFLVLDTDRRGKHLHLTFNSFHKVATLSLSNILGTEKNKEKVGFSSEAWRTDKS